MAKVYLPKAWSWVELSGPDTQDFLHRLTTANTKYLKTGTGTEGLFLNPQGKIRAYFHLWNTAPQKYEMEFDPGSDQAWKTELLAAIDQFTFAENMTLTDHVEFTQCVWVFLDEQESILFEGKTIEANSITERSSLRICHHGSESFGRPWISVHLDEKALSISAESWIKEAFPGIKTETVSEQEVEYWRIQSLKPKVQQELTQGANPLEIGLKSGIADNKGCYPGQEVIEKIIALGSPAKRLALISGDGAPPPVGSSVLDSNIEVSKTEVGKVTSAVVDLNGNGRGFLALATLRKTHAKEGLSVLVQSVQNQSDSPEPIQVKVLKIAPYTSEN